MSQKLKHFGHSKRQSGLERTVIEGTAPGKQDRAGQHNGGRHFGHVVHEAGDLVKNHESFQRVL